MQLDVIFVQCQLNVASYEQIHGGDISQSFCLYTRDKKYFLKVNSAYAYPGIFVNEADGLKCLSNRCDLKIPGVVGCGAIGEHQYLVLEWLRAVKPPADFWRTFAVGLASLHKETNGHFGWKEDNYIGALPQTNTQSTNWANFYGEYRLKPLALQLKTAGVFQLKDLQSLEQVCQRLHSIFPAEPPSLLHGDLWSGNFLADESGAAAIFDPAVYFGHREMDIGMTKLFGGFDAEFYEAYQEHFPLEKGWEQRIPLTQLYPILVHAVLFGAQYILKSREIIKQFS
ncbi:MAG: fructosamine kinase family protein [Ferruginibacter sp.]|nr:fructosamine kinase family protein [Ferruginibacter sp.]